MSERSGDLASNRRATHDYEILETFEAGISLTGTEIKSIRDHGASLQESFVKVMDNEVWLIGCSIAPYKHGNINNHEERRQRKLLMHKREIQKLKTASQEKGQTIITLAFYLKNGRVKVKIATAKGKKAPDKRADIKERDEKKKIQQAMKQHQ